MLGHRIDHLHISCPRCGRTFESDEIEPEPKQIDEYTPEEKRKIVDDYCANEYATCPIDDTSLKVQFDRHTGGWFLIARCPRCGREFEWTHKDDEQARTE